MKIERISDNQIRCTLTSFDLSVRNLNLGELAYGSEKARSLFREMIQKASNEVGFEVDDIPLMVEAIPLSNESVMLLITKVEDPEELDTRFAKLAPSSDDDAYSDFADLAADILEGADRYNSLLNAVSEEDTEDAGPGDSKVPARKEVHIRAYLFNSLDQISDAARAAGQVQDIDSTLYKKPNTREYYLVLKGTGSNNMDFSRFCNILSEYGTKVRADMAAAAHYQEHYEVLIETDAIGKLSLL